jgi:hypothetical protein
MRFAGSVLGLTRVKRDLQALRGVRILAGQKMDSLLLPARWRMIRVHFVTASSRTSKYQLVRARDMEVLPSKWRRQGAAVGTDGNDARARIPILKMSI